MTATAAAVERATALLDPARLTRTPAQVDGYVDLLGEQAPPSPGLGQDLMLTRFYPRIYTWWRPIAAKVALSGLSKDGERDTARRMLGLAAGQNVLDLACGPGNFTEWFGAVVGPDGLAVGVDASPTMLARAALNAAGPVAYLRADAEQLPFADASFDAVCCFAALFLMAEPMRAIDHIARVLRPGGRVAILTSCASDQPLRRAAERAVARVGRVHVFGRTEITEALAQRGLVDVEQQASGVAQFVSARKPDKSL